MVGLKGYRTVGGIRASIYNAMPVEGCQVAGAVHEGLRVEEVGLTTESTEGHGEHGGIAEKAPRMDVVFVVHLCHCSP